MGCRAEPAVVHIAHVLQKVAFLSIFHFFYNLHDLTQKKFTRPYRKKKINFFYNSHDLPQKKNYTTRLFLYTTYIFHLIWPPQGVFFLPYLSILKILTILRRIQKWVKNTEKLTLDLTSRLDLG